ncbi:MAG: M48 family metallopeptidase [Candidatus Kapaibacterium sp.]
MWFSSDVAVYDKRRECGFFCRFSPRAACFVLVLMAALQGCSDFNVFPLTHDVSLGANIDKELRTNAREYPVVEDAVLRSYVQDMVKRITASPEVRYAREFPYTVTILDGPSTINAFCTPGGYIYVYTGLLKTLDNEASLAAVLGHEIAHAECRHSTERMTKAMGAQLLLDVALGSDASQTATTAANLFTGLALLKNSRDEEVEADAKSFSYLQHTDWYPGAIRYFFEKIRGASRGGAVERWTSTHPLPQDRIDATEQRVRAANLAPPTEARLRSAPYLEMRRRIR